MKLKIKVRLNPKYASHGTADYNSISRPGCQASTEPKADSDEVLQ